MGVYTLTSFGTRRSECVTSERYCLSGVLSHLAWQIVGSITIPDCVVHSCDNLGSTKISVDSSTRTPVFDDEIFRLRIRCNEYITGL